MKKITITVLILFSTYITNAQRAVEKQISIKPNTSLDLKLDFADTIHITQSKNNSITIVATVNINDNLHNDKYELIVNESIGYIDVSAKINDMKSLRVPCRNHKGSNYDCYDGKCLTMDINYEIEVPLVANLKIETISGDIIIDKGFNPMYIKSISGFIDLGLPSTINSDIKIKTITGGVYTNMDFNKDTDEWDSHPGGTDAYIKVGKGGDRVRLETISGDIYIRKL